MSSHERNSLDKYLERYLKNWTAQYRPPADGRVRLMRAAALQASIQKGAKIPLLLQIANALNSDYSEVSFKLLVQATSYSLQTGIVI